MDKMDKYVESTQGMPESDLLVLRCEKDGKTLKIYPHIPAVLDAVGDWFALDRQREETGVKPNGWMELGEYMLARGFKRYSMRRWNY